MTHIQRIAVLTLFALVCLCMGRPEALAQQTAAANLNSQKSNQENVMKFNRITPNLVVADMEKSLRFYKDVLGFEQKQTVPDKAPYVFVWVNRGDSDIFLNLKQKPAEGQPDLFAGRQIGGTLSLYVGVEGIEDLLKTVEQRGVKIAVPLHKEFYGMKEFAVFDPDGYLLIFAEQVH